MTQMTSEMSRRALEGAIDLLTANHETAARKTMRYEAELADAKAAHIRDAYELPALEAGMAMLGQAYAELQRALAARVAAGRYGARTGAPSVQGLADFYGPIGRLLHELATRDWPDDLRPEWAPRHPGHDFYYPHERREVRDMAAKIAAELDQ